MNTKVDVEVREVKRGDVIELGDGSFPVAETVPMSWEGVGVHRIHTTSVTFLWLSTTIVTITRAGNG